MGAVLDWAGGQSRTRLPDLRNTECASSIFPIPYLIIRLYQDLAPDFVKPYKVDDKTVDQALELRHGKSVRVFPMDKVSNGAITPVC